MAGGWDSRPSWRMLDHPAAELCHFPSSPSPESLAQLKRLLVVPWGFCMSCSIVKPCLTLRHHKRQHVRLLCSLLSPGICSNSCPLHLWCQPTDSSSVTFFSCPQSYPESGSFSTSRLFISGGQSIGASALASVPPVNIQGWFFFFAGKISLILKSQLQWYRKEWKGDPWKVVKPSSATRLFSKPGFATFISYAAAAARSLQSCLTLCNPIDDSPPGSPIPGILQARTLEWVAISFSNAWKWKVKVKSLSHVQFLVTPWTAAYQAPPFMGVSRQEYWSGLPLPSPLSAMWSWQMTYSFFFCLNFFFHKMIIIKMLTNQWLGGTKQLKHVKFLKQCLGIQ